MSTSSQIKTQMAMVIEATAGTYVAPVNADHNIKFTNIDVEFEREEYAQVFASGRHSVGQSTMGKGSVTIKARAPMLLGATTGVAGKIGKAFR